MCPTGKICYPSPQHAWHTAGRIRHRIRTSAADKRHTKPRRLPVPVLRPLAHHQQGTTMRAAYDLDRCKETYDGRHGLSDVRGRCPYCGRKYEPAQSRPRGFAQSDLSEAYAYFFDPDWGRP